MMLARLSKSGGKIVDAILILAAGKGKRLVPETLHCPKPFLELGNVTILERLLNQCQRYFSGIPIFVNFSYLPHTFLKEVERIAPSIRPQLLYEESVLGPTNTVQEFSRLFPKFDDILVIHGDIVVSNPGFELLSDHCSRTVSNFVVTHLRESQLARSCVRLESPSKVKEIIEKSPNHLIHARNDDGMVLHDVCLSVSGIFYLKSQMVRQYKLDLPQPISPGLLNFLASEFVLHAWSLKGWRFSIDGHQSWRLAKEAVVNERNIDSLETS